MRDSILIYSNYCRFSLNVLQELENSPIKSRLKFVCIDSKNVREKLPSYISSVPTLIIGKQNSLIVGENIIQWIRTEHKRLQQSTMLQKADVQHQRSPQHIPQHVSQQSQGCGGGGGGGSQGGSQGASQGGSQGSHGTIQQNISTKTQNPPVSQDDLQSYEISGFSR